MFQVISEFQGHEHDQHTLIVLTFSRLEKAWDPDLPCLRLIEDLKPERTVQSTYHESQEWSSHRVRGTLRLVQSRRKELFVACFGNVPSWRLRLFCKVNSLCKYVAESVRNRFCSILKNQRTNVQHAIIMSFFVNSVRVDLARESSNLRTLNTNIGVTKVARPAATCTLFAPKNTSPPKSTNKPQIPSKSRACAWRQRTTPDMHSKILVVDVCATSLECAWGATA